MSYLKYDHFTLEDCHEVARFFPHCNSDLDWLAAMFLIQGHRLKCGSCHFILCCMAPLKQQLVSPTICFSKRIPKQSKNVFLAHLPNVEQVAFFIVSQVSVENEVAVSSVEVSVPFRIHRDKFQILNPPHLKCSQWKVCLQPKGAQCGFWGLQLCIKELFR